MSTPAASSVRSKVGLLAVVTLSALMITVAMVFGGDWFRPIPPPLRPLETGPLSTPFFMPGLQEPPTQPAATAAVPDDAEVIGVSAGGRHRAYLVSAMSGPSSHVVNDALNEVPVTVTFCDRSRCARVFTGPGASPLNVGLGGIKEERLLIRLESEVYFQETGERLNNPERAPFPYPSHPFERTTWKKWKEVHPDTDIFLRVPPPSEDPAPPTASKPAAP